MAISIDTRYLSDICINDPAMISELLHEWVDDTETKIGILRHRQSANDGKGLFNTLHELKTNFFMLGYSEAIRGCEEVLATLDKQGTIFTKDIDRLADFREKTINELRALSLLGDDL
ncbi:MAG: hypothetical protein KBH75_08965 [Saprospiraceae bacterium]|jgi:HPt (histidine-containing phosphotransfer) domain-containing protein|nr:hypothetical protein [Saprospiraceae bacterium]